MRNLRVIDQSDFRTPLHLAASEGHVDICRFLVERGARVNRSDRWGGSPLDDAHRHRHGEVIAYLRQQGATFGEKTQLPRFIQAASEGDREEVEALLEFANIDIDEGDYDRRTALHLSCGEGRKEIVELLCRAGANPNVEDRWQNRPLDDAQNARKNAASIMSILVKYGARSVKNPTLHEAVKVADNEKAEITISSSLEIKNNHRTKKQVDSFSGTIAYCPPELFREGATPTPASDMWAAGVIMFVLLTGT
jgi:ankyrin repeat protein